MPSTLLLCACTKKKRKPTRNDLQFRTLPQSQARELAKYWFAKTDLIEDKFPARELYAGPGWSAALNAMRLSAASNESKTELFILSAGFGLLRGNDSIPSYDASFSSSSDCVADRLIDSVGNVYKNPDLAHRAWWRAINEVRVLSPTPCANLAEQYSGSSIVIAAGKDYIAAAYDDLTDLARTVGPERLFILSVGYPWKKADETLQQCAIPLTIEAEKLVRGARSFINTQLLSWLLTNAGSVMDWDRVQIQQLIQERLEAYKTAHPAKPTRNPLPIRRMSDAEISQWIRKNLSKELTPSRTTLLHQLRNDLNRSCSQERFKSLYKKESEITRQNMAEVINIA